MVAEDGEGEIHIFYSIMSQSSKEKCKENCKVVYP